MAALSGVAESPERLERIVVPYEKKGIYEVELYAQAKWWKFVVDDLLPTRKGGKYLRYAKPAKGNAIWPMIFEKAFAKFHTSYGQLSHGQNYEALYTITGMPFSRYNVSKLTDDQIFEIMHIADQQNYIIQGASQKEFNNIVTDHAYTVIGVETLETPNNGTVNLLKLRNPWGMEMYDGHGQTRIPYGPKIFWQKWSTQLRMMEYSL